MEASTLKLSYRCKIKYYSCLNRKGGLNLLYLGKLFYSKAPQKYLYHPSVLMIVEHLRKGCKLCTRVQPLLDVAVVPLGTKTHIKQQLQL